MDNKVRDTIAAGGTAYGAWISTREPLAAEVASRAGYDYVCIDLQHGLCGFEELPGMLQAVATGPAFPIVRVPWNEHWMIMRALDAGALAIIVPLVNSAEEAERAAAACRFPPHGERSFGPALPIARYGASYYGDSPEVMCIVQIETARAVEQIDQIAAVEGIDALYVGPADLSLSMGMTPAMDQEDQRFHDMLAAVVEASAKHDVIPASHTATQFAAARQAAGFQMLTVGFDQGPMIAGLRGGLEAMQKSD